MKHFSSILLLLALFWTWQTAHSEAPIPVRTHFDIQSDLIKIIETTIRKQLPNSGAVKFQTFYTEATDDKTVIAHFKYAYVNTETAEQTQALIGGTARIEKDPSNAEAWILQDIQVNESSIEFKKGTVISSSPGEIIPTESKKE